MNHLAPYQEHKAGRLAQSNLRGCRGKYAFTTKLDALRKASHLKSRGNIKAFHCPTCGNFHLGRPPNSQDKRPKVPAYEQRCARRYGIRAVVVE